MIPDRTARGHASSYLGSILFSLFCRFGKKCFSSVAADVGIQRWSSTAMRKSARAKILQVQGLPLVLEASED